MPIWSLSSKKCLTGKRALLAALALSLASPAMSSANVASSSAISASILSDLHHRGPGSFESLLSIWQKRYGTQAVPALLQIAKNRAHPDQDRYVALMGVAKIGGTGSAPLISPLLKDTSWMIRNGSLRAMAALGDSRSAPSVLPLLSDPALVVRLEAVQTAERLRPTGTADALIQVIRNPENYHAGRAQWVPQHALEALQHLATRGGITTAESRAACSKLTAMLADPLSYHKDASLRPGIEAALRAMRGQD